MCACVCVSARDTHSAFALYFWSCTRGKVVREDGLMVGEVALLGKVKG